MGKFQDFMRKIARPERGRLIKPALISVLLRKTGKLAKNSCYANARICGARFRSVFMLADSLKL